MIVLKLQPPEFFRWFFLNRKKGDKNMKSKIIITGAILCAITTTGAQAVTKCVALNSSTTCTSNSNSYYNKTDWAATCTTNGVSTPISGIGICSSTKDASQFATATELDTSSTSDDNTHCWCKMTSPAVSRWVFDRSYSLAGNCARPCAYRCAYLVQSNASFRSAMFGSLSD